MQSELAQRDDEINKLNKRVQELDREIMKLRKEKDEEVEKRE